MAREQKRLKKKELREDPLMTALTESQLWLAEHGKKLAIGVLVVAVAVVAVVLLRNMRDAAEMESRQAFADTQLEIAQGDPEADMIEPLLRLADNYDGTSGGAEALYTAAELALNDLDNERAAELFGQFLREYKSEKLLIAGAKGGLATALENQGRHQEAAEQYERLAGDPNAQHYRYYALLSAGSAYTKANMYDKAREMYQTIVDEKDVGDLLNRAQEELARLDVMTGQAGLP